jgi:hypothetical protein
MNPAKTTIHSLEREQATGNRQQGVSEKRCGELFLGYLARNPTPNFVHPATSLIIDEKSIQIDFPPFSRLVFMY